MRLPRRINRSAPELGFQQADLLADGRLRRAERARRARDAESVLRDGAETAQVLELHDRIPI